MSELKMIDVFLEYKYLWDGTESEWGLVNIGTVLEPVYAIFNDREKSALIIDNDEIYDAVVKKMLEAKRPIWGNIN